MKFPGNLSFMKRHNSAEKSIKFSIFYKYLLAMRSWDAFVLGTVPLWRRRFGADFFGAETFLRRCFGADTFWRQEILASLIFSPKVSGPKPLVVKTLLSR